MTDPVLRNKADIRARYLARRRDLKAAYPNAGRALVARFPFDAVPVTGRIIAAYWPMASEIDPRPLMAEIVAHGGTLALPVIAALHAPLLFRHYGQGDALMAGPYGVMAPGPDVSVAMPDVILLPLVAFDGRGVRLGMGAGYYDRTVAALRGQGHGPLLVGLAYAGQEVPDHPGLPCDDHDVRLDWIVTDQDAKRFS